MIGSTPSPQRRPIPAIHQVDAPWMPIAAMASEVQPPRTSCSAQRLSGVPWISPERLPTRASVQARLAEIGTGVMRRGIWAVPRGRMAVCWPVRSAPAVQPPLIVLLCSVIGGTIAGGRRRGLRGIGVSGGPAGVLRPGVRGHGLGAGRRGASAVDAWGTRHASCRYRCPHRLDRHGHPAAWGNGPTGGRGLGPAAGGFVLLRSSYVGGRSPALWSWSRINSSGTDFLRHWEQFVSTRDQGAPLGEPSYPRPFTH